MVEKNKDLFEELAKEFVKQKQSELFKNKPKEVTITTPKPTGVMVHKFMIDFTVYPNGEAHAKMYPVGKPRTRQPKKARFVKAKKQAKQVVIEKEEVY